MTAKKEKKKTKAYKAVAYITENPTATIRSAAVACGGSVSYIEAIRKKYFITPFSEGETGFREWVSYGKHKAEVDAGVDGPWYKNVKGMTEDKFQQRAAEFRVKFPDLIPDIKPANYLKGVSLAPPSRRAAAETARRRRPTEPPTSRSPADAPSCRRPSHRRAAAQAASTAAAVRVAVETPPRLRLRPVPVARTVRLEVYSVCLCTLWWYVFVFKYYTCPSVGP